MLIAVLWGGLAAASLLIGYVLAGRRLSNRNLGVIMGVGAGALISAIAYELIPESTPKGPFIAFAFALGALVFFAGDWLVDRRGGAERKNISAAEHDASAAGAGADAGSGAAIDGGAAIFIGTLLDNVPESIILGMGLALGGAINVAFLAAVFVSNLPEGVAGTVNLQGAGVSRSRILRLWVMLVIVSAACAGLGYFVARSLSAIDGRYVQAFAAGAMLTMLADAMMPEAFEHGGKLAGLATVFGFLAGAILS